MDEYGTIHEFEPTEDLRKALKEAEEMRKHPEKMVFYTVEEFLKLA